MLVCSSLCVRAGWRRLLVDVDIGVAAGEFVAVLGENGAGKTTLLRALAGDALTPLRQTGRVSLCGRPIAAWSARARARLRAVLPQHTELAFAFTAEEVARLGRYPHGGAAADDALIAQRALQLADAAQLAQREVATLSGGERARVFMAAALAQLWETESDSARFLLLDEPTAALDLAHQHHLLATARAFAAARGLGVLAILHDLNLAAQYADRVLVLRDGRLLAQGCPREVLTPALIAEGFAVAASVLVHPLKPAPLIATAQRTSMSLLPGAG
ncbi:MAG: heme ABC transporter ATP-binding protein [Burkholderiaceae bacterium]|jgi:iron complex transport system ATP-binding protein|nr:heme ABC transporter ATP-binding protein [Burkholderiaceae bacterium]